jgi:hypothetical protein
MSDKEWAGSVETSKTFFFISEALTEKAAAQVVLPVPPLPPKKTYFLSNKAAIFNKIHTLPVAWYNPYRSHGAND